MRPFQGHNVVAIMDVGLHPTLLNLSPTETKNPKSKTRSLSHPSSGRGSFGTDFLIYPAVFASAAAVGTNSG
jgi:hypothetical protein